MARTITKKELVERVAGMVSQESKVVRGVVQAVLDAISEYLVDGRRVELRNFGVFAVKRRRPRIGRNPNEPEKDIKIPAIPMPTFKAGKLLKQLVRKGKA